MRALLFALVIALVSGCSLNYAPGEHLYCPDWALDILKEMRTNGASSSPTPGDFNELPRALEKGESNGNKTSNSI